MEVFWISWRIALCRMWWWRGWTTTLKRHGAGIKDWTVLDEQHASGEFTVKLFGWSKERRFVVVRERVREPKAAVGRTLLDVRATPSGSG